MTAAEQWRPVVGYEGIYEVSDAGRVRSIDRIDRAGKRRRGKMMAPHSHPIIAADGRSYVLVTLSRDGGNRSLSVHRLVLRAFVGEPGEGEVARHLNGARDDNRLSNLAWGTGSENNRDAVRHRTHREVLKTHCPSGHEYAGENLFFNKRGHRFCRECSRARSRAQKAAWRAAAAALREQP